MTGGASCCGVDGTTGSKNAVRSDLLALFGVWPWTFEDMYAATSCVSKENTHRKARHEVGVGVVDVVERERRAQHLLPPLKAVVDLDGRGVHAVHVVVDPVQELKVFLEHALHELLRRDFLRKRGKKS